MKKKLLSFTLLQILVILLCFSGVSADTGIGVYLTADNGSTMQQVPFPDVQPVIIRDRVMIPVRGLFENLGCTVSWDQNTSTATVNNQSKTIKVPVGSQYIFVNGQKKSTDVPAQIVNSRTLIPVRAVSEALGLKVEWDAQKRGVVIYQEAASWKETEEYQKFGSAGYIDAGTVIVSIFVTDTQTSWDFTNSTHNALANEMRNNIGAATSWISEKVKAYNANAEFFYDWAQDDELVYSVKFYQPLVTSEGTYYYDQVKYIEKYIDTDALLKKYDAKNIIYMFFFNTPYSNQHNSWSVNKKHNDTFRTEIINIYHKFDDKFIAQPSVYAHEIMHCFGAKDLYYANKYIPQSYVDYCKKNKIRDIMFTVDYGKEITCYFSELDAYYMGLTQSCDEVKKWNMQPSDYVVLQ